MRNWFKQQWGMLRGRIGNQSVAAAGDVHTLVSDLESGNAIPDDLIDAVLNGEISPESTGPIFNALRREPGAMDELDRTEYTIDALKGSHTGAPDLSGQILGAVNQRRGLLNRTALKRVWMWRGLAAAAIVLSIAGVFVAERLSPDQGALDTQPSPLFELVGQAAAANADRPVYLFSDPLNIEAQVSLVAARTPPVSAASLCSKRGAATTWCPYRGLLPAAGPASVTARWVQIVGMERSTSSCELMRQHKLDRQPADGSYSTLRTFYRDSDPQSDEEQDAADRGDSIFKR